MWRAVVLWCMMHEVCWGLQVQQDVEDIFNTVDKYMYGGLLEPIRKLPGSEARPRQYRAKTSADNRRIPSQPKSQRSAKDGFLKPLTTFPVGVILSDNLYPLVVGKNVETGKPFVMDLSSQHALVVARGGGQNYKMVIPFPVILGTPAAPQTHTDEDDQPSPQFPEYKSRTAEPHRDYSTKTHPYNQDHSNTSKQYTRKLNYYESRSTSDEEQSRANPHKIPKKYFYHYLDSDQAWPGRPRHVTNHPSVTNKHPVRSNYRNYHSEENIHPHPANRPLERSRAPVNVLPVRTRSNEHRTYHMEGSKYDRRVPKKYIPQEGHVANLEYDNADQYSFAPTTSPRVTEQVSIKSAPLEFRPSPYLGNITEDQQGPAKEAYDEITEVYESYDDRGDDFTEQDYKDSIRDRPESHSSTGQVRHVTYHADDYLGKIYEEMYYRTPDERSSSSHLSTQHVQGRPRYQSSKNDGVADVESEATDLSNSNVNVTKEADEAHTAGYTSRTTLVTVPPSQR